MLRSAACAFMAIALVCVSSLARAQEDYSRVGCYLGLAGTVAFLLSAEDALERVTGLSADVDESLGLHARGGCRGKWAGGEVHFEWLEGFDAKADGLDFKVDGIYVGKALEEQCLALHNRLARKGPDIA